MTPPRMMINVCSVCGMPVKRSEPHRIADCVEALRARHFEDAETLVGVIIKNEQQLQVATNTLQRLANEIKELHRQTAGWKAAAFAIASDFASGLPEIEVMRYYNKARESQKERD